MYAKSEVLRIYLGSGFKSQNLNFLVLSPFEISFDNLS